MRTIKDATKIIALTALTLALFSCGGEEPVAPLPEATVEETELAAVEAPEFNQALITFLTGEAYIKEGDGWVYANIGDYLEQDDVFKVDVGYAELQFGDIGTARIQEGTTISLSTISFTESGSQVDVKLLAGQVLNKVEHLASNERYEVRTETAVMGVRGTEFGVRLDENQETRVAVRDGRVGVLPAAADPQLLQEKAGTSARANAAAEVAIAAIQEISPVVEANQELVVNQSTAEATEEVVRQVSERIEQIAIESPDEAVAEPSPEAGEEPETAEETEARTTAAREELLKDSDIAELVQVATESVKQAAEISVEPVREMTEESKVELDQIEEIRVIQIPTRAAAPAVVPEPAGEEGAAETTPEPEPAPKPPALIPIIVEVEPADATISLDGRAIGQGRFQGIFLQGEVLDFSVAKDGHVSKELRVEVQETSGRSYSVKLPEIPRPEPALSRVQIEVMPSNAEIFVNDEQLGTRRVRADYEVGQELRIRAELDGYRAAERTLTVLAGRNANQVSLSLERAVADVTIDVDPEDATISVNGEDVAVGSFEQSYPLGTELGLRVTKYGYDPEERIVVVGENNEPVSFSLQQAIRELVVETQPDNVTVTMNGTEIARGSARREFAVGTEVKVAAALDGYYPQERTVTVEEENQPVQISLERIMGTLSVNVRPTDTEIIVDGTEAGRGQYQQEYPSGTTLELQLRKAGYATLTVPVTIQEGANDVSYELSQDVGSLRVSVTPATAEVLINGVVAGTGTITQDFPAGQKLNLEIRQRNYEPQTRELTVEKGQNAVEVALARRQGNLSISAQPNDSRILINGTPAGLGSITRPVPLGDEVTITVQRPGFADATERVRVNAERIDRSYRLEPQPIEADFAAGTLRIVRRVVTDGETIYSADSSGTVRAHSLSGRKLWEIRSNNTGNENSCPTVFGDRIVFTGAAEMVDVSTGGTVVGRRALSGDESHLFGRRVVGWNQNLLLPTDAGLLVLDRNGVETGRFIDIQGGSKMTPLVVGNRAVLADQQGTVHIVDLSSGSEITSIPTGMNQPVAHAPVGQGSIAVMAGRRGVIAAVDVAAGTLLWEDSLDSGSGVFVDPVASDGKVMFLTRNQIEVRSIETGAPLFPPLTNATIAPVQVGSRTYYGTANGNLNVVDAETGRRITSLRLPAPASAAPATIEGRIVIGLENGHIVVIHPDGL